MALQLGLHRRGLPSELWRPTSNTALLFTQHYIPRSWAPPQQRPALRRKLLQPARARQRGKSQDDYTISIPPPVPVSPTAPENKPAFSWPLASFLLAVAAGAAVWWRWYQDPDQWEVANEEGVYESDRVKIEAYRQSLAGHRAAVCVNSAISALEYFGDSPKAMFELRRALQYNSTVRKPITPVIRARAHWTPELYQFFVCNSDLPLDSNVQTQLQEMFGISPEEGDRLEREILEDNRFYSI